ncbi:MAG TPA: cyanophycin synthetase [Rubrobacteraceae bacterium]|nr:cyanophycin synthetase [Rubrobacteraceae bacterium]
MFHEVCEELDRRRHVTLGFERIERLLNLLGKPERGLRIVQVVGTNGKGTTAVAIASALETLGFTSGAYLSPHVLSYTERVMIRGRFITEEDFAGAMGETIALADANGVPASQFELLTAGAIKLFHDAGLDFAVLEAGLGARHDATSAAPAEAVVLTNVSLDHTEYLGETVEEISREKLASLRPGATLFLGTGDPAVLNVARGVAASVKARTVELPPEEERRKPDRGAEAGLPPYAEGNVRLGVLVAENITGRDLGWEERERVARSVAGVLPARFEVHEVRGVPVVVDGGHNAAGIEAALGGVRRLYGSRPLGLIFGVLRDKDAARMLAALAGEVDLIVITRPLSDRAAEPEAVADELRRVRAGDPRSLVVTYAGDALEVAVEEMRRVDGVVLVTGSLYTGAAVLGALREG